MTKHVTNVMRHISIHDDDKITSRMFNAMNISCACNGQGKRITRIIFIPSPSLAARGRKTILSDP